MYSALRPAVRRLLSVRSTSFLARSTRPISTIASTTTSARLYRPAVSLRIQRRFNSIESPKEAADENAETATPQPAHDVVKSEAESASTLVEESENQATKQTESAETQTFQPADDVESRTLEEAVPSVKAETTIAGEVAEEQLSGKAEVAEEALPSVKAETTIAGEVAEEQLSGKAEKAEEAVPSVKAETTIAGEVAEEQLSGKTEEAEEAAKSMVDDLEESSPEIPDSIEKPTRAVDQRHVPKETVYIGNLFFDVTAEDLKERMSAFGVVEYAKIIHDGRGLSKGFGYVTFDSVEAAARAIAEMNQNFYEGRRVVVQYASGTFRSPNQARTRPPSRTLYIGNISFDLSDRELNDLFKSVRNVIDVRVAIDRQTGQPRGFAHADFIDVASAQVAAEILSSKAPHGRRLKVDFSHNTRVGGERK